MKILEKILNYKYSNLIKVFIIILICLTGFYNVILPACLIISGVLLILFIKKNKENK